MENPEGYQVLTDADIVAAAHAPAECDWSPWLTPHPLPDTGAFLPGDVITTTFGKFKLIAFHEAGRREKWRADPVDDSWKSIPESDRSPPTHICFTRAEVLSVVPGWRAGQIRRVSNELRTFEGYIDRRSTFVGEGGDDFWLLIENDGFCFSVREAWKSDLLHEAPSLDVLTVDQCKTVARIKEQCDAPAPNSLSVGYTFAADDLKAAGYDERAYLRRPMDPEKVARAREAIDRLTARTVAAPTVTVAKALPGPRREVSSNGREWVNYDKISESYPFDLYKRRRINGVDVGYVDPPVLACAEPMTKPCGRPASWRIIKDGMVRLCDEHNAAMDMLDRRCSDLREDGEAARARMTEMDRNATAAAPSESSCQPTLFGGIWRPW